MQDNLTRPLRAIGSCLCILVLAVTSNHSAGAANQAVTTVFAVVVKRLDTKSARLDQELTLRTIRDVVLDGVVIIPSGSRVVGHVVEVATKGKGSQQSILAIVIDNAVLETGTEIPLQAIIAAVAAPQEDALSSDPTYGMMHSNEPRMDAKGAASAARTGDLSPSSKADSTATVSTARINGGTDKGLLVKADSQGAIGFSDLSLTWRLTSPPAISVFSSNNKEVKLEAGTEVLLRMAPPRLHVISFLVSAVVTLLVRHHISTCTSEDTNPTPCSVTLEDFQTPPT